MLVYISGPYRSTQAGIDDDQGQKEEVKRNIQAAKEVAIECWKLGHSVICPHMNSAMLDWEYPEIDDDTWMKGCIDLMCRCDHVIVIDPELDRTASKGTKQEIEVANQLGIPISYGHIPPLHPTEVKNPLQCESFINMIMKMYRVHLSKNADYSPANVLGTGGVGVVVRLWDKIARIMNLSGFDLRIDHSSFDSRNAKPPENESLLDSYYDLSVYAIIAVLLNQGKWGK